MQLKLLDAHGYEQYHTMKPECLLIFFFANLPWFLMLGSPRLYLYACAFLSGDKTGVVFVCPAVSHSPSP